MTLDYYPFGLKQKGYNSTVSSNGNAVAQKFKYQGQELEEELGKNTYAYQWRDYDPALGRFNKSDRYAEKYYSMSNYAFTANNPIVFREIQGDSIQVAEQYREQFNSVLESTFGDNSKNFSYDKGGNLVYNGSKKDFKGDERKAFKQLNKVINSETVTEVLFEEKISMGGQEVDVQGEGGALVILASENEGLDKNILVVNPNGPNQVEVATGISFVNGQPKTKSEMVATNRATDTFHELGHIIFEGQDQTNVITFDNLVRGIQKTKQSDGSYKSTPLQKRPATDLTHSSATIQIRY